MGRIGNYKIWGPSIASHDKEKCVLHDVLRCYTHIHTLCQRCDRLLCLIDLLLCISKIVSWHPSSHNDSKHFFHMHSTQLVIRYYFIFFWYFHELILLFLVFFSYSFQIQRFKELESLNIKFIMTFSLFRLWLFLHYYIYCWHAICTALHSAHECNSWTQN